MWKTNDSDSRQPNKPKFRETRNQPSQKDEQTAVNSSRSATPEKVDIEELLGLKESGSSMSLLDMWYLVRERWLLGLLVGLILAGIAATLILRQPKQYESNLQFARKAEDRALANPIFENIGDPELEAHVTKVTSQNFLDFLASDEFFPEEIKTALGASDKTTMVARLSRAVSARKTGSFVRLSVRHSNPETAAALANYIREAYPRFDEQARSEELDKSEVSLRRELDQVQKALDTVNQEILELGERAQLMADGPDLEAEELGRLKGRRANLESEIRGIDKALELVSNADTIEQKLAVSEIAVAPVVVEAERLYREAEQGVTRNKDEGMGPNHPDMKAAFRVVAESEENLEAAIQTASHTLENSRKVKANELEEISVQVNELTSRIGGRSEHAGELAKLETLRQSHQQRMRDQQNRIQEIRLQKGAGLSSIEALDRALPNYVPVSPDKRLALLASLGLFGLSMIGLPIALGLLDTRLKSISEIERFLGIDCLATIPAKKAGEDGDLGLAVMMESDEAVVESFRVLYSSLRMVSDNDYPQTMLVTSSAPSEGKSFVSTNLAAFFAEQGKRTLVIDCDFRKPTQHRNVKESNDQGVIRWYHSDEPVPQDPDQFGESKALGFLALGESENLFLLRAGGTSKSPTAMIESRRFAQLVHSLRGYFDVILFDTPPVGLFSDALFVADYADESVFVTKFKELNRHKVKFALSQLQRKGCNVLGVVVNYLTSRGNTGYGYGYSDYGYGHYTSKDYARYYSSTDAK